jgi:hypothetical protein
MTRKELQAFLNRYTFNGAMSLLRPRWDVAEECKVVPDDYLVYLRCTVPDRDTNAPISFVSHVRICSLWAPDFIQDFIQTWLLQMWTHEFHESLNFDNKRVTEVH